MYRYKYIPLRYHRTSLPCLNQRANGQNLRSSWKVPNPKTYIPLFWIDSTNFASPLHRRIRQSFSANSGPAGSMPAGANCMYLTDVIAYSDMAQRLGQLHVHVLCVHRGFRSLIWPISVRDGNRVRSLHTGNMRRCKIVDRFKKLSARGRKQW